MKKRITINIAENRGRQKLRIVQPDRDISRKKDGPFPPTSGGPIGTADCIGNEGNGGGGKGEPLLIECRPTCEPANLFAKITGMSVSTYAARTAKYPYTPLTLPSGSPRWLAYIDGNNDTTGGNPLPSYIGQATGAIEFSEPVTIAGWSITQETLAFSSEVGGPGKACADHWGIYYTDSGGNTILAGESVGYNENDTIMFGPFTSAFWAIAAFSSPYEGSDGASWSLYKSVPIGVTVCSGCEHAEVVTPSTGESVGTVGSGSTGITGNPLAGSLVRGHATYKSGSTWVLATTPQRVISLTVDSLPTREWTWDGGDSLTFDSPISSASEVFVLYVL